MTFTERSDDWRIWLATLESGHDYSQFHARAWLHTLRYGDHTYGFWEWLAWSPGGGQVVFGCLTCDQLFWDCLDDYSPSLALTTEEGTGVR